MTSRRGVIARIRFTTCGRCNGLACEGKRYGGTVAVSEKFDRRIRASVASQYRRASDLVRLGAPHDDGYWVWNASPASIARADRATRLRLPHTFVAEVNALALEIAGEQEGEGDGVNLPLSQARELLVLAAGGLGAIASVTQLTSAGSAHIRRASIGSIARTSLEHSATALWVIEGASRQERLKRAILIELDSIGQILKYLPRARPSGEVSELLRAQSIYVDVASTELGLKVEVERTAKIGGEQVPKKTELIDRALSYEAYPELSAFAHPNSFHSSVLSRTSGGYSGQFFTIGESTLHTEARLVEPALLAFGTALIAVARYIDVDDCGSVRIWLESCATLWGQWCRRNGCSP